MINQRIIVPRNDTLFLEAENLAAAAQSNSTVNASNGGTPLRHRSSIYKQAPLLAVLNEQVLISFIVFRLIIFIYYLPSILFN